MNPASLWVHASLFVLALLGFAGLALAMERHQTDLWSHALPRWGTYALRCGGWGCLLACLCASIAQMGWGFGLAAFSGHTSAAAGVVLVALLMVNRQQERSR